MRLDVVAMLLHRLLVSFWWSECLASGLVLDVYLYIDASPQRRGVELFAASYDWCCNDGSRGTRLLPFISLDRLMLDAIGKTLCLAWQSRAGIVCGSS